MGKVFRYYYCAACGKRYRGETAPVCGCGGGEFKATEWYISFYALGSTHEEKGGPTRTIATRKLKVREAEVAEKKFTLVNSRKVSFRKFILGDYWNLYAKGLKSSRDYRNRINQVVQEFGDYYLHLLRPRNIDAWEAKMRSAGNSPATITRQLNFLKGVFAKAVEWDYLTVSPMQGKKIRRITKKRVRFLTKEEFRLLMDKAGNDMLRAAMTLAVGTGLRRSALFGMKWEHINLETQEITIPESLSKSGKPITIPINEVVLETLKNLPKALHSDYILNRPRTGTRYRDMRTAFERAKRLAGIINFTWHGFRDTFASWHRMAGTDLATLKEYLGLSSIEMVQVYAHITPEYRKSQAENISHFLRAESVKKTEIVGNN